jgi:hypothetical protein
VESHGDFVLTSRVGLRQNHWVIYRGVRIISMLLDLEV